MLRKSCRETVIPQRLFLKLPLNICSWALLHSFWLDGLDLSQVFICSKLVCVHSVTLQNTLVIAEIKKFRHVCNVPSVSDSATLLCGYFELICQNPSRGVRRTRRKFCKIAPLNLSFRTQDLLLTKLHALLLDNRDLNLLSQLKPLA